MKKITLIFMAFITVFALTACNKEKEKLIDSFIIENATFQSEKDSYVVGEKIKVYLEINGNIENAVFLRVSVNTYEEHTIFEEEDTNKKYIEFLAIEDQTDYNFTSVLVLLDGESRRISLNDKKITIEILENIIDEDIVYSISNLSFDNYRVAKGETTIVENDSFLEENIKVTLQGQIKGSRYKVSKVNFSITNSSGTKTYSAEISKEIQGISPLSVSYEVQIPSSLIIEGNNSVVITNIEYLLDDAIETYYYTAGDRYASTIRKKIQELSENFELKLKSSEDGSYYYKVENNFKKIVDVERKNLFQIKNLNFELTFDRMPISNFVSVSFYYTLEGISEAKKITINKGSVYHVQKDKKDIYSVDFTAELSNLVIEKIEVEFLDENEQKAYIIKDAQIDKYHVNYWDLFIKTRSNFELLYTDNSYKKVILINDVVIGDENVARQNKIDSFSGYLEGNGKKISDRSQTQLFNTVEKDAIIKNLEYYDYDKRFISSDNNLNAVFALVNKGTIQNVKINAHVLIAQHININVKEIYGFVMTNEGNLLNNQITNTYAFLNEVEKLYLTTKTNTGIIDGLVLNYDESTSNLSENIVSNFPENVVITVYALAENMTLFDANKVKNILFDLRISWANNRKISKMNFPSSNFNPEHFYTLNNVLFTTGFKRYYRNNINYNNGIRFLEEDVESTPNTNYFVNRTKNNFTNSYYEKEISLHTNNMNEIGLTGFSTEVWEFLNTKAEDTWTLKLKFQVIVGGK